MRRLVKVGDLFVQPVDGQRVLDEVVGADAEKLHALGQAVGDHRRGRRLDHHPDLDGVGKGRAFGAELGAAFVEQHVGGLEFLHAGDHRVHDFQVAKDAGPQDGAELRAEQVLLLEAEPDGAPAEERIHLLGDVDVREQLVAAEIERADDHRGRRERLGHPPVGGELFLLVRQVAAVDEQELGAKQADAGRAALQDTLDIGRPLDVGGEDDPVAVLRFRRVVVDDLEALFDRGLSIDQLAVFKERLV